MRLRELTLQGYKSFATKHCFRFPSVITAIVGPNGSGKSNIADAFRWALGEQRPVALRAKRTDDLIFAGTNTRRKAGLAEVSLTIDNSDGWLDIDFPEVVLTRRAHRDGTNEYFINGARVRLADLRDLLDGRLGRGNYTVIGQGLVDSALAMKPEDRRGLIDEAAGVVPLQRNRDATLRRLAEADENLTRVRDILAELAPRLRRMRKLDERAARFERYTGELETLLRTHYGYHWPQAAAQVREARLAEASRRSDAENAAAAVEAASAALDGAQEAFEEVDAELARQLAGREELRSAAASARQMAAVARTRLEGLLARRDETAQESDALASQLRELTVHVAELETSARRLEDEKVAAAEAVGNAEAELAAFESEQTTSRAAVEEARAQLFACSSKLAAMRSQLEAARSVANERALERDALGRDRDELSARLGQLEHAVSERATDVEAAQQALGRAEEVMRQAEAELGRARAAGEKRREEELAARAGVESLCARREALETMRPYLDAEQRVRALLGGAAAEQVVGTVGELLDVAPGWERAVAAAVGPLGGGVVVRDSATVDRLLTLLEGADAPALALVPADAPAASAVRWAPEAGARAYGDVAQSPRCPALAELLLADVTFHDTLAAARTSVARPGGPPRAAARTGQVVHRGGAVLTGAPAQALTGIDRELGALPSRIESAAELIEQLSRSVAEAKAEIERLERRLADAQRAVAAAQSRRDRAAAEHVARQRELETARKEWAWTEGACERLSRELDELASSRADMHAAIEAEADRESELTRQLESMIAAASLDQGASLRASLRRAEAEAARIAQAAAVGLATLAAARAEMNAVAQRQAASAERLDATAGVIASLEAEQQQLDGQAEEADRGLARMDECVASARAAVKTARRELRLRTDALEQARRHLAACESRLGEARLTRSRAEDRAARLHHELLADRKWLPEIGDLPADLASVTADNLPFPGIAELEDGHAERLAQMRRRLSALGAIDHEALSAYRETAERHDHLSVQKADLEAAIEDLRTALRALDTEIATRFETTFDAVAGAFAATFPALFGGGEAALMQHRAADGSVGIDIVARPPGKRPQPLSLLSGGERAITAVALIFALLRVSRTPFVVLDEVDAALDEANVERFCRALVDLAEATQIVIITHNRDTIQRAGAVYGVTMGDDGASEVISMRVDASV